MRDLHPDFEQELSKGSIFPVQLVSMQIEPEPVYYWNGLGPLHYGGNTYLGLDRGAQCESVQETNQTQASSISMRVFLKREGEDMGFLTNVRVRGKEITVMDALLDDNLSIIAVDTAFRGIGGDLKLRVNASSYELEVTATNELEGLKSTWGLTHSESDQKRLYAGDTSHRFLPFFQDVDFQL